MIEKITESKSKTFIAFCFSFLAGIAIASVINRKIDFIYFYFFLMVFGGFLIIFWKNQKDRFVFLCLILFTLAMLRYDSALPKNREDYVNFYNGQNYEFTGIINAEPDIRLDGVRYIIQPENLKGGIYLKSKLYPRYNYGDKLKITCDLTEPKPIEDFRYDMYLMKMNVFAVCFNPKIEKISAGEGNIILQNILSLKDVVAQRINELWHEPYAGFMAGLLYGYRGGLGDLQEEFNRTGVSHIVAISGYNISLIASILVAIFVHLLIPRKKAFYFVSLGIFLFVVFTGASGSVVRAGIMGFLVLLAGHLGRLNRINNAFVFTAALMAFYNPFVLIWDVGFQLSFLAAFGIIYLSPVIQKYFNKIPEFLGLRESFVSTISAIVITLPLILYQFGRLSVTAPLVNILILWTIPWIMMAGFFAVVFSFAYYPLGQIISFLAFVGLKYVVLTVHFFSSLSFFSVDFKIPIWVLFALYLIIFLFFKKSNIDKGIE